ncbi:MAG TPA: SAM-dependent methyltransferase [Pseudonocardiaceae bacterium]|nr:SAM-dependent methyltransferase [Pseudonocardiaceae bacterium]
MTDEATAVWVPKEVDLSQPSVARMYDYLLGGAHNFEVDREITKKLLTVQPNARDIARRNRAFLQRVVRFLVGEGIRQFLDLGSGIPTVGNVHEVAQQLAPGTRVVYADYERVAVAHSQLLLDGNDDADIVCVDVTRTQDVLTAPATTRLLDFSQPIGILAVTLGHYLSPESDPAGMFGTYRDAVAPGSYLALTHLTNDFGAVHGEQIIETMRATRDNVFPRSRAEVMELFTGFELVEPGMVTTSHWRPEDGVTSALDPEDDGLYAAVGRRI